MKPPYDAILIVSFGGPEKREDVIPFLENVLRGRNIPRKRMREVADHYEQFGGESPLNGQVRELIEALRVDLDRHSIDLPIYWGNRNWHPLLDDTMQQMADARVQRAIALVLSAYSSYSSCRQYLENIADALRRVGPDAPAVDKIRVFYNHPDFIAANADHLRRAIAQLPPESRGKLQVAFTAHSIPSSMATTSEYERQLKEACRLVCASADIPPQRWNLVYQSRSGRPQDAWLEPDICDHLASLKQQGVEEVVVMPIGFLSDHLEVLYDLDQQARDVSAKLGLHMVRAATVGTHPQFVSMLCELVRERLSGSAECRAVGRFAAGHDVCPADCCPAPVRPSCDS